MRDGGASDGERPLEVRRDQSVKVFVCGGGQVDAGGIYARAVEDEVQMAEVDRSMVHE